MASIYVLTDPRDERIRYVGWCHRTIQDRLARHLTEARRGDVDTHKCRWIRQLFREGLLPEVRLVESTDEPQSREVYWIDYFREQGCDLTNSTVGGSGILGLRRSEATKAKMRDKWKDEAYRKKIKRGWKHSPETKEKIRRSNSGKTKPPRDEATKAKTSATLKSNEKHRQALILRNKERAIISPEQADEMRRQYRAGVSVRELISLFGTSSSNVYRLLGS